MSKLNREQIKAKARQVLAQHPNGIRWSDLLRAVETGEPNTPHNSIHGGVHNLLTTASDIVKVTRGTYVLASNVGDVEAEPLPIEMPSPATMLSPHIEQQYYGAFAEWLKEELEEATHAEAIGGNLFKGKWGTPDVIGVLKAQPSDLVRFEPRIVSAEIKTDPYSPVVAFGQAIAYRLYSHKSYMVMPDTVSKADLERMDALTAIYGIGLVTFSLDPESPNFSLRIRAVISQPDIYYVNEMARKLFAHSTKLFNSLF